MKPDICPVCGEVVPEKAKACPECGSDETTGWSDNAKADNLGIPSDDFDYDDYVKREFDPVEPRRKNNTLWIVTAIILLLSFAWFIFG